MAGQQNELRSCGDEDLASQAQAGSLVAFETLMCRYEGAVYRYLRRLARNGHLAQDLTQETFVRAYRNLYKYDPTRRFAAWLFTLARRGAISHLRSAPPESGAPIPDATADVEHPVDLMSRREESGVLWALARRTLSEVQFSVLWLRYAEDMDTKEVARTVGRTQLHVKVLLHRARKVLGRELRRAPESGCRQSVVGEVPTVLCSPGATGGREGV